MTIINVQQQNNSFDCGSLALAYETTLILGKEPTNYNYTNIREHLMVCFNQNIVRDFSISVSSRKMSCIRTINCKLFFICRGIYIRNPKESGYSNMTARDNCNCWFHDNCFILIISNLLTLNIVNIVTKKNVV